MKNISIGKYQLAIHDSKSIGICVSGGADSALLLYIVMANITQHIHVYTFISPDRREAIESHVDAVVDTCSKLTDNSNFTYHKEFVNSQKPDGLFSLFGDKFETDKIEILYFALTKFPPKEVWEKFEQQQPAWHNNFRDAVVDKPLYGISIPVNDTDLEHIASDPNTLAKFELVMDERAYVPWVNLNKKDIASMYRELGVEDQLFKVSRSCETPAHVGTHCGKCWWCDERRWAFGYLE